MNYDDFFNLKATNKEMAYGILFVVIILVLCFSAGYLLGVERAGGNSHETGGIQDNGTGINDAREQFGTVTECQHEITAGISESKEAAARIEGGIQQINSSAEQSAAAVSESGNLISDCQQIIGTVRNRGKTYTPTN